LSISQTVVNHSSGTHWMVNECTNTPVSYRFLTNSKILLACVVYLHKMNNRFLTNSKILLACVVYLHKMNRVALYGNDMLLIIFVVIILRTKGWVVMKFGI